MSVRGGIMAALADLADTLTKAHSTLYATPIGVDGEWVRTLAGLLIDARGLVASLMKDVCDEESEARGSRGLSNWER